MESVVTQVCPPLLPALLDAVADYPRQGSQPHQYRLYCTMLHCLTLVLRRLGPRLWGGSPSPLALSSTTGASQDSSFAAPPAALLPSGPEELGETLTSAMTDAGSRDEGTGKVCEAITAHQEWARCMWCPVTHLEMLLVPAGDPGGSECSHARDGSGW
jgi:hypothetical protein